MWYALRAVITIVFVLLMFKLQKDIDILMSYFTAAFVPSFTAAFTVPLGLFSVSIAALLYLRTQSAIKAALGYVVGLLVAAAIMLPIKDMFLRNWTWLLSIVTSGFIPVSYYSILLVNLLPISKVRRRQRAGFVGISVGIIAAIVVGIIAMLTENSLYGEKGMEKVLNTVGRSFWHWVVPTGIFAYAFYRMHLSLRSEEYSENTVRSQIKTLDSQF
jgi:hypothetical protein